MFKKAIIWLYITRLKFLVKELQRSFGRVSKDKLKLIETDTFLHRLPHSKQPNSVPQGSVLGPSLSSSHMAPLEDILKVLKLVKSCWRTSQSFAPKIVRCSLVSSAYKAMLVCSWMASGRSLINITKRSGPIRLPWGTQVTGRRTQASPSITTLRDLSVL